MQQSCRTSVPFRADFNQVCFIGSEVIVVAGQEEGRLWQACGVLAAAGALRSIVLLLRRCGTPDCAAAFVAACHDAGYGSDPRAPSDSGVWASVAPVVNLSGDHRAVLFHSTLLLASACSHCSEMLSTLWHCCAA